MEEAVLSDRRRRHHSEMLNDIEADLTVLKEQICDSMEDTSMLRRESGFKPNFLTHDTWMILREKRTQCAWAKGI